MGRYLQSDWDCVDLEAAPNRVAAVVAIELHDAGCRFRRRSAGPCDLEALERAWRSAATNSSTPSAPSPDLNTNFYLNLHLIKGQMSAEPVKSIDNSF